MVATNPALEGLPGRPLRDADFRRARTWLRQTGGVVGLSEPAWLLLAVRLRARRRAALRILVPALLGMFVAGIVFVPDNSAAELTTMVVAFVATAALLRGVGVWELRASETFAQHLHGRTSRGRSVGPAEILGAVRVAAYGVVLTAQVVFLVGVAVSYPVHVAVAADLLFVVEWSSIAWLVADAARRPTVAVDPSSVAIDERLRSQDASAPLVFTYFGALSFLWVLNAHRVAGHDLSFWAFALEGLGIAAQVLGTFPRRLTRWNRPSWRAWWGTA